MCVEEEGGWRRLRGRQFLDLSDVPSTALSHLKRRKWREEETEKWQSTLSMGRERDKEQIKCVFDIAFKIMKQKYKCLIMYMYK